MTEQDYEGAFRRARRALGHLYHKTQKGERLDPAGCDGCREIHQFLTDPSYRGDQTYPLGDRIGSEWKLGPDDLESSSSVTLVFCSQCESLKPLVVEPMTSDEQNRVSGDLVCGGCGLILETLTVPAEGEYGFVKLRDPETPQR